MDHRLGLVAVSIGPVCSSQNHVHNVRNTAHDLLTQCRGIRPLTS